MACPRYKAEQALINILPFVGDEEFVFAYVRDIVGHGPGIMKKMENTGMVSKVGRISMHGSFSTLWKVSKDYIKEEITEDMRAQCRIFTDWQYQIMKNIHKWSSNKEVQKNRESIRPVVDDIRQRVGNNTFKSADLKNFGVHGVNMQRLVMLRYVTKIEKGVYRLCQDQDVACTKSI